MSLENTLEICSGCGKMPRSIDYMLGIFSCSRCGHKETIHLTSDSYYLTHELDRNFHELVLKKRLEEVSYEPLNLDILFGRIKTNPLKKKTRQRKMIAKTKKNFNMKRRQKLK